ncbi:efflux RND transporter periplasmic adaptor subunit [Dyella acidiphila]|uniref:Efflux RND transporter periplasmic adaptor subunit n=1 Tax=Dyella acidiphila TaxID=2775866 RepID=A0ABR9GAF6_9GAMM|nr:efflux RND transporter periplasmic adaptor subunit [Dyella acidiphila]MBE1161022.1 efflux RND transporter periplasmic adaptor subunit [Dyella acidiphila]
MNRLLLTCAMSMALLALLAGCSAGGAADDDDKPDVSGQVLVSTTSPVNQTFHDTVQAWGAAVGDPHRSSVISLGHGGQVTGIDVAAGQVVKRGQVLLRIAPDPAARNTYLQAQSGLSLATGELQRTEQMAAQHLATQSQLAAARKALDDARTALDAQRALGGGDAEETIAAPADGVVTTLGVNLGDRFQAAASLLTFTPAHGLIARLGAQPEDAARLQAGMPVQVKSVYGDGKTYDGRVEMVGQAVDAQTHLLPVQVTLPPQASASWVAGAAVQASIETAGYTAWALPRDAVLHDDQGDYVYAVDHAHARRIAVSLKHPEGDTVGVQGPLDGKTRIIVLGSYELNDGDAVREQQEPAK